VTLAQELEEALVQVATALEAGDAAAATQAGQRASALSLAAQAAGQRIPPEALPGLCAAQARAEQAAGAVRARIVGELGRSSAGRRAASAYGP
jgi:hypothetical protein